VRQANSVHPVQCLYWRPALLMDVFHRHMCWSAVLLSERKSCHILSHKKMQKWFAISAHPHAIDSNRGRAMTCAVRVILSRYVFLTSRVSSVSIVSDYGLADRAIGVRSQVGVKDFSSNLCVQTGSGAHPASFTMGTGVLSLGIKRGRGVTLTTHPHLVPRSWKSRSYTSSPPKRLHGV
jgi:hypothetical protein